MTERDLASLLRELDTALERQHELDEPTRALLVEVRTDLDRVLATRQPDASLADKLRNAVTEFEKAHPTLVEATQRVIDQLANLGF